MTDKQYALTLTEAQAQVVQQRRVAKAGAES